jgi:hypothetical protein
MKVKKLRILKETVILSQLGVGFENFRGQLESDQ